MSSLDRLDDRQKAKLEQFQAVTQTDDLEYALTRLSHYNWNLERAVSSVYDGNNEIDSAREKLEQEVAASTQTDTTSSSSSSSTRTSSAQGRPFRLTALLAWPFGIAWNITWAILSFASRLLSRPSITSSSSSSSSSQRMDPRTAAAKFIREFETKYNSETHVPFFEGGYSQALETARRDLRFLLVVLQCDEHDDTDKFCRDTLTSAELVDYIRQKDILVWGGNVRESEAFQVSSTLQATTYPFMAIIALQSPNNASSGSLRMACVDRIEGPASAATIISRLDNAIQRYGPGLNRLRMRRQQQELERRLRQEQDQAYRESLKADQEKERKARESREAAARAEEEAKQAEKERLELAEKRRQYIRYLCRELPAEPDSSYQGEIAKLSFRLADGERVIRKFRGDDTIEMLYKFVEAYPVLKSGEDVSDATAPENYRHKYGFTIISPYPRTVYEASDGRTVKEEKSLWPSATLIVDVEDDEQE